MGPLPAFLVKDGRLIDDQLPIGGVDRDFCALQRAWSRPLEVDSGLVVAAAVARALELVLRRKPVRRAAKMGADGDQGIHRVLRPHDPDTELVLPALVHFADRVIPRKSRLEFLDRLEENVRKKKTAEDAGETADSCGEKEPRCRENEGEAAAGDFTLVAYLRRCTPCEGSFRSYLIWRDFFRHRVEKTLEPVRPNIRESVICVNEKGD